MKDSEKYGFNFVLTRLGSLFYCMSISGKSIALEKPFGENPKEICTCSANELGKVLNIWSFMDAYPESREKIEIVVLGMIKDVQVGGGTTFFIFWPMILCEVFRVLPPHISGWFERALRVPDHWEIPPL